MILGIDANEANVKNRMGSGVYAANLLHEFSKSKKHQFVIYLKEKPLEDLPKQSSNFKYKIFGPKRLWTRFALPIKLAFGPKIDIFFTLGHYGPHFSRAPYAITIFDLSYLHYPALFNKSDLYQLVNWSKHSVINSKHIFTISQSSKKDIVKNYNVNPAKVTVTYPGYDTKRFKPQPNAKIEATKKKYEIQGNYIIFVGTLQPRKNIERLIIALSNLIQDTRYRIQDTQLVIVGKKGWLYEPIFEKVQKLKLKDQVIFTNYVPDVDLSALISGAKVYVLPSLWEGFGIPVIEAQACGVPVVVSNVSSLPEIVGEGAILINPESVDSIATGLQKVLINPKTRSDLVAKGFKNIKRFSWQICADQTLKVLSQTVG